MVYLQMANTALTKGEYLSDIDNYKSVLRFRPGYTAVAYNTACSYSVRNYNTLLPFTAAVLGYNLQ